MTGPAVPLGGTEWAVVELGGDSVELSAGERAPTLVFDLEESRVAGFGGVNRLAGVFTLNEDELRFGRLATTKMAGAEASDRRERHLLDALAHVTAYELDGRSLALLRSDEVVVRLAC